MRRGAFTAGEKVQLIDRKGNKLTEQLVPGAVLQTVHGFLRHDEVIGAQPGSVVTTHAHPRPLEDDPAGRQGGAAVSAPSSSRSLSSSPSSRPSASSRQSRRYGGWQYMCFRPRMADYMLSMPRGAQIMYPKDIAQALSYGDIRRGARVLESGGGSGAMSLALLDAVGPEGSLTTLELREEFARISQANITLYFGTKPSWWDLRVTDFDTGAAAFADGSFDRIVLDLLDPWNRLPQAGRVLAPGGVLVCYVTTTTQMGRLADDLRASGRWTEPEIVELMERTWKAEGLAVRPDHEMIGHTGFLVISRLMAPGFARLEKQHHGGKDTRTPVGDVTRGEKVPADSEGLSEGRDISDHKLRRVLRDLARQERVLGESGRQD